MNFGIRGNDGINRGTLKKIEKISKTSTLRELSIRSIKRTLVGASFAPLE
jgi:hypothetical protein